VLVLQLGFDAFFFARADYQDLQKRRKDRTMEVIWQGSKSLGSSAQIFAGVLSHHYEPPSAFSFDIDSPNPPFQDDPRLSDYNVPELVDLFVEYVQNQVHSAAFTQTSDSGLCKCNSPFSLSFWV
jgi:alpha-mannosidase